MKLILKIFILLFFIEIFCNGQKIVDEEGNDIEDYLIIDKPKPHGCSRLLREFAAFNKDFAQCAVNNAVPVTMCSNCTIQYNNTKTSYEYLYNNETCRNIYFNNDRLQIIASFFKSSQSIWEKAFCPSCNSEDEINKIRNELNDAELCIKSHSTFYCKECLKYYDVMNVDYTDLDKKYNGKVCYDIQDRVNTTREVWSKNCSKKKSADLTIFAVLASVFLALPVLFYAGFISYAIWKNQNNHETLSDADLVNQSSPNNLRTQPTTNNTIDVNQASTSAATLSELVAASESLLDGDNNQKLQENTKKNTNLNDDSDSLSSTDDESILNHNKTNLSKVDSTSSIDSQVMQNTYKKMI